MSRSYGWLVLTGYCALALAIPVLTPAVPVPDPLPPITPLMAADRADDAMMQPLRLEARAALQALQTRGRQAANTF